MMGSRKSSTRTRTFPARTRADTGDPTEPIRPLWMVERDVIEEAIAQCGGNIVQAATLLGIDGSTIYRKRRRWKDMPEDASMF